MKAFIFLCLISLPLHAQRSIGPQVFQVNVRPVLSGILNDFYQMITLFPDFPKELIPVINFMDELDSDKEIIKNQCPRIITKACIQNINSLRNKLASLQFKTQTLIAKQPMSPSLHMSSLGGLRTIYEFQAELEEIKGSLDNSSFLIQANIKNRNETYQIIRQIDGLNTLISLTVVEFIPYLYRNEFRHFYFNFVRPIQLQISKNHNYEFLNRNVNTLNFSINLLNMNLTKKNKKTPEGMAPYLSALHNRWNSILRYYF